LFLLIHQRNSADLLTFKILANIELTHIVDYISNMNITNWEEGSVCKCACVQGVKAKLARLYKQLLGHTMYLSTLIGM